jgi:hypothetical protein
VPRSTMLVTQSSGRPGEGGANFILGNAFSFGLLDARGMPLVKLRGQRSGGFNSFEQAVLLDLPYIVYMYWTGYVLHKPFGEEKNWASPSMNEAMRLLSFHTAQRLRRYRKVVRSIGPIDEPGLAWGKTPAGGMASGFPNWDEKAWYEQRGWQYTPDITSRTDADWMKYLTIRCAILKENYAQARKDFKTVWPDVVWSGDLYAPHAVMDGTDPLNQAVNDIPASHVFFDFFGGPMAATGQIYLEKAHDPLAPLAHAMNGQLTGARGPPRPLYHLLMNNMLAAGIHSNWWLNTGGMSKDDLAAVNGPAERIGPLFRAMTTRGHDLALLWSFTEIGMREKDIVAREARKKSGEQIKLLLPLPEKSELKEATVTSSPYEVGEVYTDQVLDVHQVMRRAGYPAHIVHERLLPDGILKNYKTLVIVGQTFAFPPEVRQAIDAFVQAGGKIVTDRSTTVKFDGAVVIDADFSPTTIRARRALAAQKAAAATTKRAASVFDSSNYFNQPHRAAVASLKAALAKTASQPVFVSDDVDLAGECHVGGEGTLLMVVNGHEKYPDVPEDQPYPRYNYAAAATSFKLQGIPPGSVVYCLEGLDWKAASKAENPGMPLTAKFAAGEMKLYLVAPRQPGDFGLRVQGKGAVIRVFAPLKGVKMPWPFTLTITAPDGRELYRVYRATAANGSYAEAFPIGANADAGAYTVRMASPVAGLSAEARVKFAPSPPVPGIIGEAVRVFDGNAIQQFLIARPAVVIAIGNDTQKALAKELADKLSVGGIKATVRLEGDVLRKVAYPRVWDPYARLYRPTGAEKAISADQVKAQLTLATRPDGVVMATTAEGKELAEWHVPGALVTIAGTGYLDWHGPHEFAYEPGCKLYVNDKRQVTVVKGELSMVKTTDEFRAKWAKSWSRLTQHVGGFQLPACLPEAYTTDSHLILLGDSTSGFAVAALQASELLPQVVDERYPGPGKALVSFAWSPFGVEKNVILVGASDADGLRAGIARLAALAGGR